MTGQSEDPTPNVEAADSERQRDAQRKALSPAARRALAEAEARRIELADAEERRRREIGGRGGKDPARYGDWEVKGIAVDF